MRRVVIPSVGPLTDYFQNGSILRWLIAVSALICIVSTLIFLFSVYPQYLHSDSASYILLAEDILRARMWLPRSWNYVSDGISIADGGQVALLFVKIFGVTPLALACTAVVSAIILVSSLYYLGRIFSLDRAASVAAGLLVISAPSVLYLDLVLGYTIAIVIAQNILFVSVASRVVDGKFSGRHIIVGAVLVALLFASNPKKAFAFTLLPSACAAAICWITAHFAGRQDVDAIRRRDWFLRVIIASVVAGYVFHFVAADALSVNTSYARHQFISTSEQFTINARTIWRLALEFGGVTNRATRPEGVFHNIGVAYRASLVVVVVAVFVCFSVRAFRLRQRARIFLAGYVFFGTLFILGALLVGEPIKEYYGIYYFVFPLAPISVIFISVIYEFSARARVAAFAALVAPALMFATGGLVLSALNDGRSVYSGPGINQRTNNADKHNLIYWLERNGISYGYAPFWDANAITVLSRGRVRVVAANFLYGAGLSPMKWLVSDEKIAKVQSQAPTFLALYNTEFNNELIARCFKSRSSHLVPPYRVVVFQDGVTDCSAISGARDASVGKNIAPATATLESLRRNSG